MATVQKVVTTAKAAPKVPPTPPKTDEEDDLGFEAEDAKAEEQAAASEAAASFEVFETETIEPPPVARRFGEGVTPLYPFDKLKVVNQWFLVGNLDKDQKKKLMSHVYKKHKNGHKYKLIKVDEAFAARIKRPDLVGQFGVWRVA